MLLTNFHTHCHYCDGNGSPLEMVEQAKQLNFKAIGFSSHAPLPFKNDFCMQQENLEAYVRDIMALKTDNDIEVYLGLEVDYIRGLLSPSDKKWDDLGLDYKVGSVHTLAAPNDRYPMLSVDGPHDEFKMLLNEVYQGSARDMIETYFQRVSQLCAEGGFDILGHYDLVKKHNKALQFFDETSPWYKDIAISTLDDVAKSGVILEVNYGGMLRGATDDVYPSPWLLKEARDRHIPIQINADAHAPHHLGVHHKYCREILLETGYQEQRVLLGGRWQDVAL